MHVDCLNCQQELYHDTTYRVWRHRGTLMVRCDGKRGDGKGGQGPSDPSEVAVPECAYCASAGNFACRSCGKQLCADHAHPDGHGGAVCDSCDLARR
jgi:hypothetical protein